MNEKEMHILNCALAILKESGDQGLSMRKVAEKAEISLSNVQYYFKTRDVLLGALLEGFLLDYAKSMKLLSFSKQTRSEYRLNELVNCMLRDVEKSECAVVFKELWAIAERNDTVKNALAAYYLNLRNMLCDVLESVAVAGSQRSQIEKAAGILLVFLEGYCVTHSSLQFTTEEFSEQLAAMLSSSFASR